MSNPDESKQGEPKVYKIATLGKHSVTRRHFVKAVALATGATVLSAFGQNSTNKSTAAVNHLLLGSDQECPKHAGPDPCDTGCACHVVCPCESVGGCVCDDVHTDCNKYGGEGSDYNWQQDYTGDICTCDRVSVCICNTICTCNTMCSCDGNHYWFPC